MNLGYDLFLDKEKLGARFIQSDIFDDQSALRTEFNGRFDVIHASNFFHVWEWGKTIEAANMLSIYSAASLDQSSWEPRWVQKELGR